MRKHIIFGLLAAASSAAFAQITIPQVAKLNNGDAGNTWFPAGTGPTAGDANTRGLAYYGPSNRIVAADRDGATGNLLQTVNADTFAYTGAVAGGSILSTGSLFVVNKVRVATDNALYIGSLCTGAGTANYHIHRHANLATTSTVAVSINANARLGDDFVTTGGGNAIVGLALGSGNTAIWRLTSVDGGITLVPQQLTVSGDTLAGFNYASFDPDDAITVWTRQGQASNTTSAPLKRFSLAVSSADFVSSATPTTGGAGPHVVARYNGQKYSVTAELGASNAQAGQFGKELHFVNLATNAIDYKGIGIERAGGLYANGNGAGDIVWDPTNQRVFVLQTSNGITSFYTGPVVASARDWNLY